MHYARIPGFLLGLGAAAALGSQAASAHVRASSSPARGITLAASPTGTPAWFQTLPDARCFIGAGARSLTIYADDNGIARLSLRPLAGAAPTVQLTAACDNATEHVTFPLTIHTSTRPMQYARPPVVADRTLNLPRGFDPVTASDADLDRYGYPPRPDANANADAYAEWVQAVQAVRVHVAPSGVVRTDRVEGNATSGNWSGMVAKGAGGQFTKAVGKWVVPLALTDDNHSPAYSSLWVGLDGYTSGDIVQDGSESDAAVLLGFLVTTYYVWIEYYPDNGSTELSNFDVNPGDQMYMSAKTCRNTHHQLIGCFYLVDQTQGEATKAYERPPHASFAGNNAEWILERPTVGGSLYDLPDYVVAATTDMLAYDTTAGKYKAYGNESYDAVSMYHHSDLMSLVEFSSKTAATFFWQNFI
jgi:Peptidase A4 family